MIRSIDHIVLTSSDIDKTVRFYCSVLGMKLDRFTPADVSPERLALCFGAQKINLHERHNHFSVKARSSRAIFFGDPCPHQTTGKQCAEA